MNNSNLMEVFHNQNFRYSIQMGLLKYIDYQKSFEYSGMTEEGSCRDYSLAELLSHTRV